jgi:hypothetical protein
LSRLPTAAWAAALCAALAPAVVLAQAPTARAAPPQAVIDQYAQQAGVDTVTAQRQLELQDKAPDVVTAMEAALGDRFGGTWFDTQRGTFHVALTTPAARKAAEEVLAARGVLANVDFETARFGLRELRDRARDLTTKLEKRLAKGEATLEVDVRANAVKVGIDRKAAKQLKDEVKTQALGPATAKAVPGGAEPVQVAEVGEETIARADFTACAWSHRCTRPLRGGTYIEGRGAGYPGACTAGYAAFYPPTGDRFLFTAGHCLRGGQPQIWSAYNDDNVVLRDIGQSAGVVVGAYGDVGSIKVTRGGFWDTPLQPIIVAWAGQWGCFGCVIDESWTIQDRTRSFPNQFVCTNGAGSMGISCGFVLRVGIPVIASGELLGGMTETSVCGHGGDSGAPVMRDHWALGIHSSSTIIRETGECGSPPRSYHTEVLDAEALLLNSRIVTSVTGPR